MTITTAVIPGGWQEGEDILTEPVFGRLFIAIADFAANSAFVFPGGWQEGEDLLPEPVLPGEAFPGPQDAVLRRGPLLVLRAVRVRRARGAYCGVSSHPFQLFNFFGWGQSKDLWLVEDLQFDCFII